MNIEDIKAMSDAKLRYMVAKLAGLTEMEEKIDPMEMWDGESVSIDAALDGRGVPDFPRSLEAMHEAEAILLKTGCVWKNYCNNLMHITSNGPKYGLSDGLSILTYVHATARQRAESFVITLIEGKG